MQRIILKSKNKISVISGILILIAFVSKWTTNNLEVFRIALIVASVFGLAPIAIQAYQALRIKVISIDVLITIAVTGAFLIKNYEEAAIVTFLFLFGAYLEMRTLNQTRSAIKELTEMAPERAEKQMDNGEFVDVDIFDVDVGDILRIKTGAKVPVDGTVIFGSATINEASITGESVPRSKNIGSEVFAGTILENGTVQITADQIGEDTTFGKIIELVEDAQDSKSEAERFIDKFSKYYTPAVLVLAFFVWMVSKNPELAITILVLGCPGALVIGVPVSNVAGIGNGARNGILLKGSEVVNDFSKAKTIIFDKTGTLTVGNPSVSEVKYYTEEQNLALSYLASVEEESDHPLAKAVLENVGDVERSKVENTEVIMGGGIVATIHNQRVVVGNVSLMESENITLNKEIIKDVENFEQSGNSLVITAVDGEVKIIMGIRDQIRSGVKEDLKKLKSLGIENLIMLSGDNQGTVDVVSQELGLTSAYGNMLPHDKSEFVKKLKDKGEIVVFVGDGINDSPSLALADVGIAMGSGTDVAIETSDIVLMNSDFGLLPYAVGLTKSIARNMLQNILIAVGVVLVLLAAVFYSDWMNMSIGMLVHEGSILVVVLNGVRLLSYKLK